MKKILLPVALVVMCAAILYYITKPPARGTINDRFTRNYTSFLLQRDTSSVFNYRIDQLAPWKDRFVFYSIRGKIIGVVDSMGKVLDTMSYHPVNPVSTIHSISTTPGAVYFFDLNGRVAGGTDFTSEPRFTDSLRFDTRGAVLNNRNGYTMIQYSSDSGRLFLYDSTPGEKPVTLFAFEKMRDRGFSNWTIMQKSQDGSNVFHVPMYNGRIIRYNYPTKQLSVIETIERTPVTDLSVDIGNGTILSSKTPVVNRKVCVNTKQLFILSYARSPSDDAAAEIVDVYDLATNRYAGSFTVPGIAKGKINAMACNNNRFAILKENTLIIFTLYEK